jgi:hypothetical protein
MRYEKDTHPFGEMHMVNGVGKRQALDGAAGGGWGPAARNNSQFAEALFFMIMASDMRERVKALGRRYELDEIQMLAEVTRYVDRLAAEQFKT